MPGPAQTVTAPSPGGGHPTGPKIELHVHLEGTVRPATLLDIARRNDQPLPADTVEGLAALYEFRDFAHFVDVWILTTHCLRTAADFREVTVAYAREAAAAGAVYLEAIFSPIERVVRGVRWEELFDGYCSGAQQAQEMYGVQVRLTPDIYRGADPAAAESLVTHAIAHRHRGVVGVGLGGVESVPGAPYAHAFARAREGGLASVPHAGETTDAASIREAMDVLRADRIRHGIRAVTDPGLLRELADRGTVLDVAPTSNLRTGAVADLAAHPLPALVAAGVRCSLATDDPAMFGTDLAREHVVAARLGVRARDFYDAGLAGACCDEATRSLLAVQGRQTDWDAVEVTLRGQAGKAAGTLSP